MIWQQDIQDAIYKHIAEQMKCSVDELHSGETNFIMDETVSKRYVKILSVGDTNVVTVSKNIYSEAMRCLRGKTEMSCMRAILYLVKHCIMFRI